ncbi:MAG: hypothetical protein JEZ00_14605 [Anaerolineaceae bacterium]|nr:hypothetical protein [Anaerolineaceae bacterium]
MNKKFFLLISILLIVSVACSFTGGKNNPEKQAEVQNEIIEEPTSIPEPTNAPVEPPAAEEVEPTAEEPVAEEQTGDPYYVDEFDEDTASWYTWVVAGDASKNFTQTKPGTILFSLPSSETYAYMANENYDYEDVIVEAQMTATIYGDNGLAVACRISEDGWYEARIHTTGQYAGSFQVYRYDQALRDEGKNPYVNIIGGLERVNSVDILNGSKTNIVALRCVGDSIQPIINGVPQTLPKEVAITDDYLSSGQVGVAAMSFGNGKVEVEVDYISVQQP